MWCFHGDLQHCHAAAGMYRGIPMALALEYGKGLLFKLHGQSSRCVFVSIGFNGEFIGTINRRDFFQNGGIFCKAGGKKGALSCQAFIKTGLSAVSLHSRNLLIIGPRRKGDSIFFYRSKLCLVPFKGKRKDPCIDGTVLLLLAIGITVSAEAVFDGVQCLLL